MAKLLRLLVLATLPLLSGCVGSLYVSRGQYLLTRQEIEGNKRVDKDQLEPLLKQKVNNQVLGLMPQLYAYVVGERFLDREKVKIRMDSLNRQYKRKMEPLDPSSDQFQKLDLERERKLESLERKLRDGNWFMRTFGEPPSIYDSVTTEETARELKAYYFNQGYFFARVKTSVDTTRTLRNVRVKYNITEGGVQLIDSVVYVAEDSRIQHLLDSTANLRLLKKGQRFNREQQVAERERLEKLLRNNGYLTFSRSLINIINDTANSWRYKLRVKVMVDNPPSGHLKAYQRGMTDFYIAESGAPGIHPDTLVRPDLTYHFARRNFREKILRSKMPFLDVPYYHQDKIVRSQIALSTMDLYRFVNFTYDTLGGKVNVRINATKLPRFEISNELGAVLSFGAPGPYINSGFKVRNAFGTMSIFEVNGRFSEEGQLSFFAPDSIYRTRELGITSSVVFPSILLPFGLGSLFPSLTPRTRFSVSLVDNFRPEYSRTQLRFNVTYTVQPNNKVTYGFSPIDLNFNWIPPERINPAFLLFLLEQAAQRGDPRILNFRNYLTTGLIGYYAYNTIALNNNRKGEYARAGLEFGGAAPSILGGILGGVPGFEDRNNRDQLWGLQVFRYYRLSGDLRKYWELGKKSVFATRLNTGLAGVWLSPGANSLSLPWEKYFFLGGPNSMRAWFNRRLGPGSFFQRTDGGSFNYFAEQPGELMIEANAELRQRLFGFFEGALFLDAGNIWTLRPDPARAGAVISTNAWREIAIGGGIGLRFNFDILIFRFDAGAKIYVPNDEFGTRWQVQNLKFPNPFQTDVLYNYSFGVGYPF